jgi:amino acid adenylation domain-containing protein
MQEMTIDGFRLSPQQKRVWTLQQREHQPYHTQCVLLLEGSLDVDALKAALAQVVERHEILRTSFRRLPGMSLPLQVVEQDCRFLINEYAPEETVADEPLAMIDGLLEEARYAASDLLHGAQLQVWLVRLKIDEHVLALSLPAMYNDTTGLRNLVAEISRYYDAIIHSEPLTDEVMQYIDISEWQNELLEAETAEAGRAYWRKQDLSGLQNLKLPYQHEAIETDFIPQFISVTIDAASTKQIEALVDGCETTASIFLLTCWQVLLWRLTAQPLLSIGIASDGRNYQGLESALGLFAKYLPVSSLLEPDLPFRQLLAHVTQAVREIAEYQEYFAWEQFGNQSQNHPQPSFFPFCFDYAEQAGSYAGGEIAFTIRREYACTERFHVRLSCLRSQETLTSHFYYDSTLLTSADISRLAAQFQTLLQSVLENVDAHLSALEIVGEAERHQLLVEWNCTATPYPLNECIHELFERQAAQTPSALALVYEGQQLTYGELNSRANQLAHHLQQMGVGAEVRVGLCVERSVEMIVGVLGILKAGAAYVPLEPSYPSERVRFMLEDTGAKVLLTQEHLVEALPVHEAEVISLDGDWEEIAVQSEENPKAEVEAENLAYVIYTSGSTGMPKGVLVTHQNLVHSTSARLAYYPDGVGRFLLLSSFAFDSSVAGIFWTLCSGGGLVLPGEGLQREARALSQIIKRQEVTHLLSLPSLYAMLLEAAEGRELATLKEVVVAGEVCRAELVERHYEEMNGARLYNEYGPTEASVWSTVYKCERVLPGRRVSIGRGISNAEIYILDERLRPAPIGVAGELYIGGDGLARGYLHRGEATAEKFIPNLFSGEAGARLYRTGDVGRYLADGNIEFLGRADNQVKIRGYRIELGEIEAMLGAHPMVAEVTVMAREDVTGEHRLVAYVVGAGEANTVAINEWRKYLEERLPQYMVPSAFVPLAVMPLMANGKVDRHALPAPGMTGAKQEGAVVAPRTLVEELLAGIWAEVLVVAELSVTANFFELGGHSLLATQVMSRVRAAFGIELPVRSLFSAPTVRGLAAIVEQQLNERDGLSAPPLLAVGREGQLPLSYAQQRLWFADQLEPGSAFYNCPVAVRLTGQLNVGALERSLSEIIRRHEVLRTTFPSHLGEPVQVIEPHVEFTLPLTDLSAVEAHEKESAARGLAEAEAERPFDLAHGPLLRASLLKLEAEEHVMLFTMHHIISDGWSMGVLIKEVSVLYEAYSQGEESPLEELEIQYADYAVWQREWLQGEVLEEQLDYWREQLKGVSEVLKMPTDKVRPAVQSFHGAQHSFVIGQELSGKLKALSRREGVTLFMTLLAAFKVLLHYYSKQDDIVVGTNVANRNRSETEGLIGFFVNTLVLRSELSNNMSFVELLKRVREVCLEAYAHQDVPFERLVAILQPARDVSRTPLFQVKLDLDHDLTAVLKLSGLTLSPLEIASDVGRYDVHLFITETEETLRGNIVYDMNLFDAATIDRMSMQLEVLLQRITEQPCIRLNQLDQMLVEADRQYHFNREMDYKKSIHRKFKQARQQVTVEAS